MKKLDKHIPQFKEALTRLTLRNDAMFFIAMIYALKHECYEPLVIRGMRTPACTDGVRLCYDAELFAKDSLPDRMYTLVHEILHVVLMHSLRLGSRDPNIWNVAADYVVNGHIAEGGKFKIPATDIQPDPAFKGLSVEAVYDLLLKEAQQALSGGKQQGKGQGGRVWVRGDPQPGQGQGPIELQGKQPHDVQKYDPANNNDKPAQQVEREIGLATEGAKQAAKLAGQGAFMDEHDLADAQVRREPWFSHLRRYMTVLNERQYNWATLNRRRLVAQRVISPDMRSDSMGKLIVSIDESGSLTDEQESAIGTHCVSIFNECRPKQVVIIRHTDRVTDVETYDYPYDNFKLVRKSSGGTDFRPVFDLVAEEHGDAQVLLMFTDMYGPFPDGHPPVDTMWITSTEESAVKTPFGERIHADFND